MPTPAYTHPTDPLLTKIFQTMQFNAGTGKPELRVSITDGVTISGNVTIPGTVTIASGGSIALAAGTASIGTLGANAGVTIGAVQIAASQTLSTVTTVSTLTNQTQMNGQNISMGTGVRDAGTQRVTIATNDSVPVTGTFYQATQPVSLASVPTHGVTGPLTDTQLRATAVPVSISGTPTVSLSDVATNSHDRLRVTDYETVWYNTFQFSREDDQWDQASVSSGAATWNSANSGVDLTTTTSSTSSIIRQTQRVMLYTPGRPAQLNQQIKFAVPTNNMTQRVGLFDSNNGFFFETVGTTINCVIRSNTTGSVVDTRVAQANWTGDKLNGTGPSGITLDFTKQQLLHMDYEWYGVGSVQFGFIMNDQIVNFHTFYAANLLPSVWCATPFLPVRLELFNTGPAAVSTLRQGSNSILIDGQTNSNRGTSNSFYSPIGGSAVAQSVFIPVLGIRLKSSALNAVCRPFAMEAGGYITTGGGDTGATSGAIAYQVIKNPTLTGASWTDHPNTTSFMQTDTAATAYTGGTIVASGFMLSGSQRIDFGDDIHFQLGRQSMGTVSDTFVVVIAGVGGARTAYTSLQWTESR